MASNRQRKTCRLVSLPRVKNILSISLLCAGAIASSHAAPMNAANEHFVPASALEPSDARYGVFGLLDHRSDYGLGVFPEPFLVDDSDYEPGEARLDWLHTQAGASRMDVIHPELEMGFDEITFELETPYELDAGPSAQGFDNVDLGVRGPLYQYVSPGGLVTTTFGAGLEAGIPTESAVSKNAELVPKLFNDLKAGNFTTQSVFGYSTLFGPGGEGGLSTFEYGFVFGYTIQHDQFPLPDVLQSIPFMELIGETQLNKENPGQNRLLANVGFRFNLKPVGRIQPRPGIGFVFPLDSGARQDIHWGIITSLVFEF
jgi:hypothetical protein